MEDLSEIEKSTMMALGASLDQTDAVLEELTWTQAELAALKAMVREMGEVLYRIDKINWHSKARGDKREKFCEICGVIPGHASNCIAVVANEILNRPEVKDILSPPREPDHQPEKG